MPLAKIPEANRAWYVLRARAALKASEATKMEADGGNGAAGLWDAAVRDLEVCRRDSLPTLDADIDDQLASYRKQQLWFRERPRMPPKVRPNAANRDDR